MRALDCCAGAGGLSLGLQRAGFDVLGVELDGCAAETHRLNVGPCDTASLWDYEPRGEYDLVAGGIPCQSHSTAGKRAGTCDPRGQLYVPFLRIAQQAKARAVLIENVRGMMSSPSPTHGTAFREVVAAMNAAGFWHVVHALLNAADYGVPQTRHRLFLVAFVSANSFSKFRCPLATHGPLTWRTVRQALALGGGKFISGRTAKAVEKNWWNGGRIIDVDKPSSTILSRNNNDLLDVSSLYASQLSLFETAAPPRLERLTLEQMILLQSLPAPFCVSGIAESQHRQVGNAVPPPLAEAVGRAVLAALRGE